MIASGSLPLICRKPHLQSFSFIKTSFVQRVASGNTMSLVYNKKKYEIQAKKYNLL